MKNGPIEGETWVTSKVRDIYSNTSFDFPETPANCSNERKQMDPFPNAVDKLKGLNEKKSYRVSQKKLSLVEISSGKYNSNIGEKSRRSFDKIW